MFVDASGWKGREEMTRKEGQDICMIASDEFAVCVHRLSETGVLFKSDSSSSLGQIDQLLIYANI